MNSRHQIKVSGRRQEKASETDINILVNK